MTARAGRLCIVCGGAWLSLLPTILLADAAEDIRDIRGPKPVTDSWPVYALLALAFIAAVGLGAFIRARRRRSGGAAAPTASQLALRRLEFARELMRPDTARQFGAAASELIRDYIERRFAVVATQRTTEEFLQALLQSPVELLVRHRALLAEFLQRCDLVKFAGDSLAISDLESLFDSARRFVLETAESADA